IEEAQLLAFLRPDSVRTALPAGRLQYLVGLLDVEFPLRILRAISRGIIEDIAGHNAGSAVDVLLDRRAIHQERKRLAYRRIGKLRMPGLGARALAIDLGPGIGTVELDIFDAAALVDADTPFAGLLQALQDLVLDLRVPRIIVLAGLQDG